MSNIYSPLSVYAQPRTFLAIKTQKKKNCGVRGWVGVDGVIRPRTNTKQIKKISKPLLTRSHPLTHRRKNFFYFAFFSRGIYF